MATLDHLTFWLDIKGAEKVRNTLKNIQKATYAETKSAISALLEPIKRREREEKKAERLRKKRQKPLDQWNKQQVKFGEKHARVSEKTLVAQMNAEQRVLYYRNKQAKLDNEFAKTRKQTREWYVARERQEQNSLELARAQGRLERQNAAARQRAYKEYLKTDSLTAYEKRQAEGADWVARKEANKAKGQARAVAIAKKRQREQEKIAESLRRASEKLEKAADKQKAIAEKQAKIRFDTALKRASQVAAMALRTPAQVYRAMKFLSERTTEGLQQEASYYLAGGNKAQMYDISLGGYGGRQGEGASAIRNTAVSLGGLRYGDTGFIQAAGRFGIGGISPYDSPFEVRKKILSRLKNMPLNEALYAASQLGITDAELRKARDTGESLGGITSRDRELGASNLRRDILTKYAASGYGSTWLNELVEGNPAALLEIAGGLGIGGIFGGAAIFKTLKGLGKAIPWAGRGISALRTSATAGAVGRAVPQVGAGLGKAAGAVGRAATFPAMLLSPNIAGGGLEAEFEARKTREEIMNRYPNVFNIQTVNVKADDPEDFIDKMKESALDNVMP